MIFLLLNKINLPLKIKIFILSKTLQVTSYKSISIFNDIKWDILT